MNEDQVVHQNTTVARFNAFPLDADKIVVPMSMKECDDLSMSQHRTEFSDFRDKVDLSASKMNETLRKHFLDLLGEYSDIFAISMKDKKVTYLVQHHIDTGDSPSIKSRPYRISPVKREVIGRQVQKMQQQGVVEPNMSPWSSPVNLIPKPDGSHRFCLDYRRLNSVTKKDSRPLPAIKDIFQAFDAANANWFSTIDMLSGRWL